VFGKDAYPDLDSRADLAGLGGTTRNHLPFEMTVLIFRTNGGFCLAEELGHVGGELGVVLEQESVGRVRVDLQPGLGDQAG